VSDWRHGFYGGLCVGIMVACAILDKWEPVVVFAALFVGVETYFATEHYRKERDR
jgi:hypothetical protein